MARISYRHFLDAQTLHESFLFSQQRVLGLVSAEKRVHRAVPVFEYFNALLFTSKTELASEIVLDLKIDLRQVKNRLSYIFMLASLVHKYDTVLDLGSHHGMVGASLARLTERSVYMVECSLSAWKLSQDLFSDITLECRHRDLCNCFYLYGAVSATMDIKMFWESNDKSVSNSLNKSLAINPSSSYNVPVYSYQELLRLSSATFLKMNIEGEDLKILGDMLDTSPSAMANLPRIIVLEVNLVESVALMLSRLTERFNSAFVISFPQTSQPYLFQEVSEHLNCPGFKPEHLVLSSESKDYIRTCLENGLLQFNRQWSFSN